jgi:hypothetical protein
MLPEPYDIRKMLLLIPNSFYLFTFKRKRFSCYLYTLEKKKPTESWLNDLVAASMIANRKRTYLQCSLCKIHKRQKQTGKVHRTQGYDRIKNWRCDVGPNIIIL